MERAIKTLKAHFKSALTTIDPNFLLSEWDKLLLQANITLNMLRSIRYNPKLSAYNYIFSTFNFMDMPLVLLGINVVVHIYLDKRVLWELNREIG